MCLCVQENTPALMATVEALSASGEMLGGELRDVFDAHPPVVSVMGIEKLIECEMVGAELSV